MPNRVTEEQIAAATDQLQLTRWAHNPTGMVRAQPCGDYVLASDVVPIAAELQALRNRFARLQAALDHGFQTGEQERFDRDR